ncbi:hereditary hemochromatosis protein homolog [Synchiropus splendidus]|uniref:hereditary hemochromatosis protein homolog n=1 Tax=Synchiropus splendidus TaxID=270530 RepID=UPI00237E7A0B|nr:hereditary hemochromatosis protein homolog [Synchiropus splendidus]
MRTFWLQLMFVQQVTSSGARQHSLWVLATCVFGPSKLPEFSGVLLLDDLQVAYYDSTLDHLVTNSMDRTPLDLGQSAMGIVQDMYFGMRDRIAFSKHRFNQTKGLHILQKLAGCEIQDGQPTFVMSRNSYDGQDIDSQMFNTTHFSYTTREGWENRWTAAEWQIEQTLYHHFYLSTCVSALEQLLEQKKNLVTRRVRPRLHVFSRPRMGGALLTCLATDFYPRHINLTLLRDGQQVEEDQLSTGPVLPNGNGLYQVRKTLVLTEQEQEHNYTCTAAHLSLDNQLQVSWRAESFHSHLARLVLLLVMVVLVLLLVLLLVLAKCCIPQESGAHTDSVGAESVAMVTNSS